MVSEKAIKKLRGWYSVTPKDSDQSDHLRQDTLKSLARYNMSNWEVETVLPTVNEAAEICKLSS